MTRTIPIHPSTDVPHSAGLQGDGLGCHAGTEAMVAAAKEAGKSEVLDNTPAITRVNPMQVRTTSPKACARLLAPCVWACA